MLDLLLHNAHLIWRGLSVTLEASAWVIAAASVGGLFAGLALHGLEIYGVKADSAAGDKLVPELRLSFNCINVIGQHVGQPMQTAPAELPPCPGARQAAFPEQIIP